MQQTAGPADPVDDRIAAALRQDVCRCGRYPRLVRARSHRAAVLYARAVEVAWPYVHSLRMEAARRQDRGQPGVRW